MNNYLEFIKKNWYIISVFSVILLAFSLRFYDYNDRWALAQDQARDAIIGREAIRQLSIPILGPFSQAGAFVMGPIWYWIVAISTAIFPFSIITPWIVISLSFVVVVYIMILIGNETAGRGFGLLLGLLTAISTSQIAQSVNLTNPSGIAIFSALAVYFSVRYLKTGKNVFLFLLSFSIGLAINIHLQGLGLAAIFPGVLILRKIKLKQIPILLAGFIIPFIPLILFDIFNNFYDFKSLIDYYLYGQHKIYVPNRWLTFIFSYWPDAWARIIGGYKEISYLIVLSISVLFLYFGIFKKTLSKYILFFFITFALMVFMLRYFKGERFDSYILFTHPFILTISSWSIFTFFRIKRSIGILFFALILGTTLIQSFTTIKSSSNYTALLVKDLIASIEKEFPNKKIAIYDYKGQYKSITLPLGLFLMKDDKTDAGGKKIGFAVATRGANFKHSSIYGQKEGYQLFILSSSSADLSREGWLLVDPEIVYNESQSWFKDK